MFNFYSTLPILFLMLSTGFIYIIKDTKYIKEYYYKFFDNIFEEKKDNKKEEKEIKEIKEVNIIKYEDKYWDKYERMMDKDEAKDEEKEKENKEIGKNNILFENTPNGNVLMFYDSTRTSFIYYADTAIPYRYLETVARKYVTTYYCLPLYINMKKEIEEAEKKINDKKEKEEQKIKELNKCDELIDNKDRDKDNKKNVFAKLKNYNTGSNTSVVKGTKLAETNPISK